MSSETVDGCLTAICIAPKMIIPDRWLTPVLKEALPDIPAPNMQRFLDVLLHRFIATLANLSDPVDLERIFRSMSTAGRRDWSQGF
ncbi:UPF0149 family protein [Sulfitobacter geojensis]|uniref:UPF0149 family protein n=1 Tax=Sulfitobacter geojensis TaxID=1342299 RepID=UPI0023E3FE0A|nr:UPF0149 family protein [Sulfitobacter geojensis]